MTRRFSNLSSGQKLGCVLWIFSLQHFLVEWIVALHWRPSGSFSLRFNQISDLGNTVCGAAYGRAICSPWHALMNMSFIAYGLALALGAWLLCDRSRGWYRTAWGVGLMCLVISGLGSALVGVFPENVSAAGHVTGAVAHFLFGAIGLLLLAGTVTLRRGLRLAVAVCGGASLVSLLLTAMQLDFGLGAGMIERLVAYPISLAAAVMGVVLLHGTSERMRVSR